MRIALCSSYVPFVDGGARNIVEWLERKLVEAGHQTERIYLPHVDAPDRLFAQMMAYRMVDLSDSDRIICFRPPAHVIAHPHKILWFIHHVRVFYDLWDSPYRTFPDDLAHRGLRKALHDADSAALGEAKAIFTNSRVVSKRLRTFNQIGSEVLYPPILDPERFVCRPANDEIVCISRIEHHKRQHLLVEAMDHTRTPVKLRICGASLSAAYSNELAQAIAKRGLQDRVAYEARWISEAEKLERLSGCLAAAYLPLDEDSYGYPALEAGHASKPVLTATDSGGVLELVQHGINGLVVEPEPRALGEAMDRLYRARGEAQRMGRNARARIGELGITWPHALQRLLA